MHKKETVHGLSILLIPDSAYNLPFVLTKRNLYQVNDTAEHETQISNFGRFSSHKVPVATVLLIFQA